MWLHSFQHERVRELWRVIWAVQDQTVSRPRSPKWPIQLCSLHIVDFSWLSKPILHFGCWDGVRGSRAFFVCGKPLMPEWVNMEETFWMRFVDLNRCRRATKYCRLVRWSFRWMVGRKGSTVWRNLFSNLNKRENTLKSNSGSACLLIMSNKSNSLCKYEIQKGSFLADCLSWKQQFKQSCSIILSSPGFEGKMGLKQWNS